MRAIRFYLALLLMMPAWVANAQTPTTATQAVSELIERIEVLKASLSQEEASHLLLSFDEPGRLRFDYLPGERPGLGLAKVNDQQREKLLDVLRAALSAAGFEKAQAIRALDDYLNATVSAERYYSGRYYFAIFGEPSSEKPWAMRLEGHHLSLNWTIAGGRVVAVTPQFMGANPAKVPSGPTAGARALAAEEDLGRALAKSLTAEQANLAISHETKTDQILARLQSKIDPFDNAGIPYTQLNKDQQAQVIALIETYVGVHRPDVAKERLKKISDAGLDQIRFLWLGSLEPGKAHYYRIQGPTFVVEYENSQNNSNHIHSGWRDFTGDYGRDPLAEHLAHAHGPGGHAH